MPPHNKTCNWKPDLLAFFAVQAIGEIYVEDPRLGKKSLYATVRDNGLGNPIIDLHNANPPRGVLTLIGFYGDNWTLKRVKRKFFLTVYELAILDEGTWIKVRCLTSHKFGDILERSIQSLPIEGK
jgi:hypothetical protein